MGVTSMKRMITHCLLFITEHNWDLVRVSELLEHSVSILDYFIEEHSIFNKWAGEWSFKIKGEIDTNFPAKNYLSSLYSPPSCLSCKCRVTACFWCWLSSLTHTLQVRKAFVAAKMHLQVQQVRLWTLVRSQLICKARKLLVCQRGPHCYLDSNKAQISSTSHSSIVWYFVTRTSYKVNTGLPSDKRTAQTAHKTNKVVVSGRRNPHVRSVGSNADEIVIFI